MIYLDTPVVIPGDHPTAPRCFRGHAAGHLMADTTEELVEYAASLGLKPEWIQHPGRPAEHFDLTGAKLARVLKDPRVRKITWRECGELIQRRLDGRLLGGRQHNEVP